MTKDSEEAIKILLKRAVNRFNDLYSAILGEISAMLKKAKLLPIPELQRNNPTFSDTVSELKLYRDLSIVVADLLKIDKNILKELNLYIDLADTLAKAIDADDYDALCGAISALDEKPYI
ncbi:hypothetical protein [Xenorhabdus thuongxuanensis]|uniref:Uncharacterized protein n=1 Tax=Xenorhabdus thuongxuanensis TaxID=1873484 RepID=A0A1Q5TEY0_9GAMM|nr:hypothetical protein [Xenorhabdus thuongxuanensis]OKO98786.1 hypothetical protein Xentx_03626 [Xenorhabdus thuongxuanensis]